MKKTAVFAADMPVDLAVSYASRDGHAQWTHQECQCVWWRDGQHTLQADVRHEEILKLEENLKDANVNSDAKSSVSSKPRVVRGKGFGLSAHAAGANKSAGDELGSSGVAEGVYMTKVHWGVLFNPSVETFNTWIILSIETTFP